MSRDLKKDEIVDPVVPRILFSVVILNKHAEDNSDRNVQAPASSTRQSWYPPLCGLGTYKMSGVLCTLRNHFGENIVNKMGRV